MPIEIKYAIPGVLGRLAVRAGQARGRQISAAQDIQFTEMALAAQDRAAVIGLAGRKRTFAIQEAAATDMARRRPAEPDMLAQRQKLRQMVSEAKAAGIYNPAQIKQAQIFATLGDTQGVRSILSKLPQESVRRQELEQQLKAVTEIGTSEISELQKQLDVVNKQLPFTPGTRQLLRERPEYMKTITPEQQELLVQQQQLEGQIAAVRGRTTQMGKLLQLGLAIPEQLAIERQREAQLMREDEAQQRRLERQTGGLTERQEVAIDMIRDQYVDRRKAIDRETIRLSKDLAPYEDEADDIKKYNKRTGPIREQIRLKGLLRIALNANEKRDVADFLGGGQKKAPAGNFVKGQIYTNAAGQRARFIGYDDIGKPMMELVE